MFLQSVKKTLLIYGIFGLALSSLSVINIHQTSAAIISSVTQGADKKAGQRSLNDKELAKFETIMFNKINAERVAHKIAKLDRDALLHKSATIRAKEIVTNYSHTRPNGQSFVSSLSAVGTISTISNVGECLAKYTINAENSYSDTQLNKVATTIHKALISSSTHKQVILNPKYSKADVGVYSVMQSGKVTVYVVEHFKNNRKAVSSLKVTIPQTVTYTGKQINPTITLKDNTKTLKKGTDYTLSYGTNKATGKATVKITGKGNYTGSITKTFYIVPKSPTGLKVTSGKKNATIKYNQSVGASGYQIAYSTSKTTGFKYVSSTSLSKVIGNLSSNKTYYIKVRAYKTVNKVNYYGTFSGLKSIKVK